MWRVNEIFHSLQGEGYHTGMAAVFVRLSGCNLRCDFCDTQHEAGTLMTLPQVMDAVLRLPPTPLLVLTGGEPSLFIDEAFVATLKQATDRQVCIESNGTRQLPGNIDWVTLSPKCGLPGGDVAPLVVNRCDELKVVYCGQDLAQYDHIDSRYRYLQPCWSPDGEQTRRSLDATVAAVLAHPQWRLSLQTHRVLGIR